MMSGLWLVIKYGSAGGIGERTSDNMEAITSQSKFTVSNLSILHCISRPFFLYSRCFLTHRPNCWLEISLFANVKCPCVCLYFIISLNFSFHVSSKTDIVETNYSPLSCQTTVLWVVVCCLMLLSFLCERAVCQESEWDTVLYEIPRGMRSHTVRDPMRYEIPRGGTRSHTVQETARWYEIPRGSTRAHEVQDPTQ